MGRPTKMTEETVRKLEEAFIMGLSDREACVYANIGASTLYDYCTDNPDFSERKEMLKESPKMRAKVNVSKSIEKGDIPTSTWYLERKARDEFSTKQTTEVSGGLDLSIEDKREVMKKRLEELRNEGKQVDGDHNI